jgi:AmmeMemoRadiSam system protein B
MIREPAVAGTFYPAEPEALRAAVDAMLAAAPVSHADGVVAVIAPHAGYIYSGPIAASVFAPLAAPRGTRDRVLLLGPSHRVALRGLAAPTATAFRTPLGDVPIDAAALQLADALPHVTRHDAPHAREHSLEVELPFLQRVLGDFTLIPFAVGDASAEEVAAVIELYIDDPRTLVVVSSDLSHYLPYADAVRADRTTAAEILAREPEITHEQACGATPVNGLLHVARTRGLHLTVTDLRNSGDTAGDKQRVVGYGAFVAHAAAVRA